MNINELFRNYSLSTESYDLSESSHNLIGGAGSSENDFPNGGFPPIFMCETKSENIDIEKSEEQVKREYKTHKTSLSIKELLEKRRKTTPFIK